MIEDGEYEIDVGELLGERKLESSNENVGVRYEFACDPVDQIQRMNIHNQDGTYFVNEKSEYMGEGDKTAGWTKLLESEAILIQNSYFLSIEPGQHQSSLQKLNSAFLVRKCEVPEKKFKKSEALGEEKKKSLSAGEQVSQRNRRKRLTLPLRRVGNGERNKESKMKKPQQSTSSQTSPNTRTPKINSPLEIGDKDINKREFSMGNKTSKRLNLEREEVPGRDEEFQDLEDQLEEVLNEDHKPEIQKDPNIDLTHEASDSESELDRDIHLNSSIRIEGPEPSQTKRKSMFNSVNSSKPTSLQDFSGIIGQDDDSASEAD